MEFHDYKIPKIIHYCWFGGNDLSELALRCIESWHKFFPDYEIKEWNETNFDINCCDYVREAYEAKKWAFVSDYARFWILYHEGGLYFDTDVELIKSIDDVIDKGAYMGCEELIDSSSYDNCSICVDVGKRWAVNPGLGMSACSGMNFYKEMLDLYKRRHFYKTNGDINTTTIVTYTTELLLKHGLKNTDRIQTVAGINIYPPDYFCPMNYRTGEVVVTNNTHSIHHYSESWHSWAEININKIRRWFNKRNMSGSIIEVIMTIPFRLWIKVQRLGVRKTLKFIMDKYIRR